MAESKTPSLLQSVARSPQTERLASALQSYAAAQLQQLATNAGRRLGETTSRLNDAAEGRGPGPGALLPGGGSLVKTALKAGAGKVKGSVLGKLGSPGGGGKRSAKGGSRPATIIEQIDVGVPVREAYDQWTRYEEFSRFVSSRSRQGTTAEQMPDERIVWSTEGAEGTAKGVVTFHELAPSLTRVVLVVEYHPRGLFEKTGSIWRAQGRRVRLDLEHFARHVSLQAEDEVEYEDEGAPAEDEYEDVEEEEDEYEYERAGR